MATETTEDLQPAPTAVALARPSRGEIAVADDALYDDIAAAPRDDAGQFRALARALWRRRWIVLSTALLGATIGAAYVYSLTPSYRASTTIELGRTPQIGARGGNVLDEETSGGGDPAEDVRTSLLVLKSTPLLEDVARRLRLDADPAFLSSTPPGGATIAAEAAPAPDASEALKPYVAKLRTGLTVEPVKDTRALSVAFTHGDPRTAERVANGVAETFIDESFQNQTARFTATVAWLERSTAELKQQAEQADRDLADYTRENRIYWTGENSTLESDKVARLQEALTKAETDRLLRRSLLDQVKAGGAADLPEAVADPKLMALKRRLGELEVLSAQLDAKYGPENPRVVDAENQKRVLREQIAEGTAALERSLAASYERAVRDETSLGAALVRAKGESAQQAQSAVTYSVLKQKADTAKSLYSDFLQKTSEARVRLAEQHNPIRVIEPARVPTAPVERPGWLFLATALALSLGAGMGLALVLEMLDTRINTPEDVRRFLPLRTVGEIPPIGGAMRRALPESTETAGVPERARLVWYDAASAAAEAFRALRTSVLLSTPDGPPRSVLVTSAEPAEGKTTTAANLAIALAQLGSSVLLVDADLRTRNGRLPSNVDAEGGLTTILARGDDWRAYVTTVGVDRLSVLPSGPAPPNPSELLASEGANRLMSDLRAHFDFVVVDSPPVMAVTDAVVLSTLVDGVLLVARSGRSSRDGLRAARGRLAGVGARLLGVVLNDYAAPRRRYDRYYHYSTDRHGTHTTAPPTAA